MSKSVMRMADEILEGMLTAPDKNPNIAKDSREERELPELSDEQRDFMVTESVATGSLDKMDEWKSPHARRPHTSHQDRPGIGASTRADKAQKASGPGPMATSYHGATRTNPTTGKREKYDQAKGWISAENAGITVTKTDKVMNLCDGAAEVAAGNAAVDAKVKAARDAAVKKKRAEIHSRDPARAGGATPPRMGGLTHDPKRTRPKSQWKSNVPGDGNENSGKITNADLLTLTRARDILRELTSVGAVGTADPGTTGMGGSANRSFHQNRAQNKTAWTPETPVAPVDKALKNVGDKKLTKKKVAKALKNRFNKKNETKKDAFEKFLELVLSDMQLEDKDWIQGAEKDIERRGTKGKCTPMTKPGCTGKALALAKTFHKMADDRDDEVESKDEKKKKKKMKKAKSK